MRYVRDTTGRFSQRPHYDPKELDRECESLITNFLRKLYGNVQFPVTTDDLTKLIEQEADDLDVYADLSRFGPSVEGVTEFRPGRKPRVRVERRLSGDEARENRFRTTLTHEYGHVHFHAYLWELEPPGPDLLRHQPDRDKVICKRETMINAAQTDWMEWQAGYVCGAILMPVSFIRHAVAAYQEKYGLYGAVDMNGAHGRALIQTVVDDFRVSADAARVRLIKLGHLGTAEHAPSLFQAIPKA